MEKTRRTCELCKKRKVSFFRMAWINKLGPKRDPNLFICQNCYDADERVVR